MQQQTYGSSQQETILAPRDPPLQFTRPAQQPQLAKILCKCRQVVLLLIYAKQNLQLVCYQEKRALPAPTCQTKLHEQLQPRQDIFDKTACSAFQPVALLIYRATITFVRTDGTRTNNACQFNRMCYCGPGARPTLSHRGTFQTIIRE